MKYMTFNFTHGLAYKDELHGDGMGMGHGGGELLFHAYKW